MKKLRILTALTALTLSSSTFADSLLDQYPVDHNQTITLSSGYQVELPFHTYGTTVGILGFIDAKETKRFVSHSKYKPVDIVCNGEKTGVGIGVFYVQDVTDSPVGAYHESVNTMLVQRKHSKTLELGCIPEPTGNAEADAGATLNYLLNSFTVLAEATSKQAEKGKPHHYGFYNDFLELDNQVSVKAGLEIWGYPKILSSVNIHMDDNFFTTSISDVDSNRTVVELSYSRNVGFNTPLLSIGDNILPEGNAQDGNLAQLSGVLATADGTMGAIRPYIGTFEIGNSKSRTRLALTKTKFKPIAVLEFTDVRGVALPPYKE
jgi:hypothetical protein